MAEGTEVAKAYVTIIPSMEGSQQTITEELTGATDTAADKAGKKSGKTLGGSLTKGLGDAGAALTKGITVPVAAAATASVVAWKSVDDAMDTVTIKTGASGDALNSMQKSAKNIATTIPASFQEAGDAVGEVNTRFGLTGSSLEGLSTQFIKFAQLNGQDVSSAIDNTQSAMAAFGLEAKDAGGFLDALNVVGQQTGVDVGSLTQELTKNAPQLKAMGLSAYDSANMLGQMDKAGIDSSTAMRGLQTAMKNASKDGVSLKDKLSEFSETMSSNKSDTEKLQSAYELFGTKAGGAIYNAVSSGTIDLNNFSGSLTDFEGSVDSTFTETLDPMDNFAIVTNKLSLLGADLVDAFGPTLASVLDTLSGVVTNVTDAWNNLSPGMQDAIIKTALVAAAIGPALIAISKVITAVNTIHTAFTTVGDALKDGPGLIGLLSNPIGIVVAAIGGAVIALVELYKHNEKFRDAVNTAWSAISSTISTVCGAVAGFAKTAWDTITGLFTGKISVKEIATGAWDKAKTTAGKVWGAIKGFFEGAAPVVKKIATTAWENAKSSAKENWKAIKGFFTEAAPVVKKIATTAWDNAKSAAGTAWSGIKGFFEGAAPVVKKIATTAWDNAKSAASTAWSGIKGFFEGSAPKMKKISTSVFDDVKDAAKKVTDKVSGFFSGLHLNIPKPKLPHITVSGGQAPFGIGGKGSLPHFSVEWYAKAMSQPMILNRPTIFGMDNNGNWLGGGERGDEVVYGKNALLSDIKTAVGGTAGFVQNLTINAPTELSPSEIARQTRNANRQMVLRLRTV